MSSYPSTLPNPVKASHAPKARNFETDLQGPASYKNRERDLTRTLEVEFFFTAEQAAEFYLWWRDELLYGGKWFNCSWPSLTPGPMVAQLLTEPSFDHVYNGAYRIALSVAVRGTSLAVDSCVLDPYYRATPGDIHWASVVMLLHFDPATGFTDSSSYKRAMTAVGAVIDTGASPLGGGSGLFDGAGDYVTTPGTSAFAFGSTSFCIEARIRADSLTGVRCIFTNRISFGADYGIIFFTSGTLLAINTWGPTAGTPLVNISGGTLVVGQWHHVRVSRSGPNFALWIDGAQVASGTSSTALVDGGLTVYVGRDPSNSARDWVGRIDELRVTMGTPRETAVFDPPTEAYPDGLIVGGHTVLALHFEGADGGTTFTDSSSYARIPSSVVACTTSATRSKFGGTSGSFRSTINDASVRYASSTDFDFPGDFTVECWAYYDPADAGTTARVIATRRVDDSVGAGTWRWGRGGWQSLISGAVQIVSVSDPVGEWYHVAISRASGVMRAFLNGELVSTGVDTNDYSNTRPLVIGHDLDGPGGSVPYGGYIDDLRITKGVARYLESFTPPALTFCDRS